MNKAVGKMRQFLKQLFEVSFMIKHKYAFTDVGVVFVWWQDQNGKEAWEDMEGKSWSREKKNQLNHTFWSKHL